MNVIDRQHVKDSMILAAAALVIGIYLIATTVVISTDGVLYIERAQKLSTHTHQILNLNEPAGFPALIGGFHHLFSSGVSVPSWVLSGQVCVLTCRTLAIVILYMFGTVLFDRRQSFWAVLILTFLPYPAQYGADVLREWPHLLFLFTALLLFYNGVRKTNAVYLFGAGLACGLGTMLRPECAQVILYGSVFFSYKLLSDYRKKLPLRRNWVYLCLAAGFLVIFLPYAAHLETVVPYKLHDLYLQFQQSDALTSSEAPAPPDSVQTAGIVSGGVFYAVLNLLNQILQNLMYYFALPAGIGFYLLFWKSSRSPQDRRPLVGLFIGFYVIALCLLHWRWGYISRRHVLPLTVLLCYCIPAGIERMAQWLAHKSPEQKILRKWGIILTVVGILICLPKLSRPIGHEKKDYRRASAWIAENTNSNDQFYSFDNRIPFYANRHYRLYKNTIKIRVNFMADYLIAQSKDGTLQVSLPAAFELQKTFPLPSADRQIVIYKRIP